ncbi:MAG TPA: serine hydrolase domain-containing protein [Kribbellaceae bacterium]
MTVRPDTAHALLTEIADAQSSTRLPSIAAGVLRDGELVWTGTRGRFATGAGALPDTDTQYRIGSITKTLTAVLVMQCRDDGLLALSDPVGKHLPGIPYGDLTVRHLLAHSGGMNAEPVGPWWERNPGGPFERLAAAMDESLATGPADRRHHYSNLGYGVLGELAARLRGESWMDLVQRRILDPLDMRRTTYLPAGRAAQGFSVHPFSGQLETEPAYDAEAMAPAGQLWSTIEDLARYGAFWLDPVDDVLSADTVAEMAAPVASDPAENLSASYGLGLRLHADGEHLLVGHTGSMPGFVAGLFVDRERGLGAVTLANGTHGRCATVPLDLVRVLASYEPPLADEWVPEETVAVGAELLGHWYWGNSPYTFTASGGALVLAGPGGTRESRFRPDGSGGFIGQDGYFAGERLRIVRAADGSIDHLDLITFLLHRTPYGR